jgi:nucleoside-diphosphate-sugar epimerase
MPFMNILITGSTGFIGKHLVEELAKKHDYKIFCLVRNDKKAQKLEHLGVKFIYADITQKHTLTKILRHNIDIIIHCAAYVGNDNKDLLYKTNVLGTQNLCELAQNLNVDRFIYLSSVAVISGNPDIPLTEDLPYKATCPYGESKIEAEKIALAYRQRGLKMVILRPCMVYGPDEPHMLKVLYKLLKCRLLFTINKGIKKLHLVYVQNVIDVIIYALDNERLLEGAYFVADDDVLSVKEVFDIISMQCKVAKSWDLPDILKPFLLNVPGLGKKVRFFLKDRIYSAQKLKEAGFPNTYKTAEKFPESLKTFMVKGKIS